MFLAPDRRHAAVAVAEVKNTSLPEAALRYALELAVDADWVASVSAVCEGRSITRKEKAT
jgi:hypothetical protein